MKYTQQLLIITLLICGLVSACNSGPNAEPDCTIDGTSVAYGDKVPTDECGGCVCAVDGQIKCTQEDCTPQSAFEDEESTSGWGVSEFYCCCKSGCPPGSGTCVAACLVFGGVCGDSNSTMLMACQGSTPLKGCACALNNESRVAPL